MAFLSDSREPGHELHDAFNVVRLPVADADGTLAALQAQVIVVDAIDTPRFTDVARVAMGGTRAVLVIGTGSDPGEAMRYLDLGASDYVGAYVTPAELIARVRSVARTAQPDDGGADELLVRGTLTISLGRREVRRNGHVVHLTPTELAILECLAQRPGDLVTYEGLAAAVWGPGVFATRQYLRLYVSQLRAKLEDDPAYPSALRTERGLGYRLVLDEPAVEEAASA